MKASLSNRAGKAALALSLSLAAAGAHAGFNSGSTGALGAFSPSANTTVSLPADGVLHYTTINIPAGVTVTFAKNAANTPVVMLATGNVTIAGTIDVNGGNSISVPTYIVGDYSAPGVGGPGGFDGGRAGPPNVNQRAGNGLGPGGGGGGDFAIGCCGNDSQPGGGGGYAVPGNPNNFGGVALNTGLGGAAYGSNLLTPLIGGSGGGGGAGAKLVNGVTGTGGGGGGGAILIASSGTVTITGAIRARGGNSGGFGFGANLNGAPGGGGSGGSIRVVAAAVLNSGSIDVAGGTGANSGPGGATGGAGSAGRTRIEVATTGTLILGGLPSLAITSVAGIAAPASPTGSGDITVPTETPNPVTVAVSASGIPVGNTVALTLTPMRGAASTATTSPLSGTASSSSATGSIDVPQGVSTLTATASYTITVAMGEALRQYAGDERVEKVTLVATYGGSSKAKLTTVSGKEFEVPAEVLRLVSVGG